MQKRTSSVKLVVILAQCRYTENAQRIHKRSDKIHQSYFG